MDERNSSRNPEELAGASERERSTSADSLNRIAHSLESIQASLSRIADQIAPDQGPVVGIDYIARRTAWSPVWIREKIRNGAIPRSLILPGTGNGRAWKFHRIKVDQWLKCR